MAIEDSRRAWFKFGRVFSRGFASFGQTFVPALLLVLLFEAGPGVASILVYGDLVVSGRWFDLTATEISNMIAVSILLWFFGAAAQTGLIYLAQGAQQRRASTFGEGLSTGLRLFLPILGLGFLIKLGVILGLFLLIVPGLILMVMWSVALPVRIHGGPGVIAAMRESSELTKGVRWQVFAYLLVIGVAFGLLSRVPLAVAAWTPQEHLKVALGITQALISGLTTLIGTFGAASLHHELKWGDRDPHEDAAAEVFA